jgi:hypothetical protein
MSDPEDALRELAAASASGDEPIDPDELPADDEAASGGRPDSPLAASKPKRPDAPPTVERDESEQSASALAELSGSASAGYDPSMRSTSNRRKRRIQKPDVGMIGLRQASIPVLITMGLVMLSLGAWGIMVKAGNDTLPMADQDNAQQLAILGLVGLPIGVLLFASAGFMFYMVGKDKQKLARWEAMQEQHD